MILDFASDSMGSFSVCGQYPVHTLDDHWHENIEDIMKFTNLMLILIFQRPPVKCTNA